VAVGPTSVAVAAESSLPCCIGRLLQSPCEVTEPLALDDEQPASHSVSLSGSVDRREYPDRPVTRTA
jgi:hypothetical protein